jgi:hypothetical protein
MDPRDDYADLDLPPPSPVVTFLGRRRWELLLALLVLNTLSFGAWKTLHIERCRCTCWCPLPYSGVQSDDGLFHDPIEFDPSAEEAFLMANREAEQELSVIGMTPGAGYRQALWSVKQRILKEKYGIDWRTPAEMNPDASFD